MKRTQRAWMWRTYIKSWRISFTKPKPFDCQSRWVFVRWTCPAASFRMSGLFAKHFLGGCKPPTAYTDLVEFDLPQGRVVQEWERCDG